MLALATLGCGLRYPLDPIWEDYNTYLVSTHFFCRLNCHECLHCACTVNTQHDAFRHRMVTIESEACWHESGALDESTTASSLAQIVSGVTPRLRLATILHHLLALAACLIVS